MEDSRYMFVPIQYSTSLWKWLDKGFSNVIPSFVFIVEEQRQLHNSQNSSYPIWNLKLKQRINI